MCIMRSLFTCQRDIGINTEKPDLTYMFCTKTENEEENTSISSFYCFPNSIRKVCIAQSLFSLLKVWPGVPGELLGKWIDMQDRQQQKTWIWESEKIQRCVERWTGSPRRATGEVNQDILVDKMVKNSFIDEHYQDRQQRKAKTFK